MNRQETKRCNRLSSRASWAPETASREHTTPFILSMHNAGATISEHKNSRHSFYVACGTREKAHSPQLPNPPPVPPNVHASLRLVAFLGPTGMFTFTTATPHATTPTPSSGVAPLPMAGGRACLISAFSALTAVLEGLLGAPGDSGGTGRSSSSV